MRILIIGSGNYVTGRGTDSYGTILPAIYEFNKEKKIVDEVVILTTSKKSAKLAEKKNKKIRYLSGHNLRVKIVVKKNNSKFTTNRTYSKDGIFCTIIATPDHTHYKLVKNCLKNKQHCLVVKPVVTKLSELKNLIKLCKKNQVYGAVEFHKRFDRQALILKDKYDSGTIGDPLYSWSEYSQKKIVPEKFFKSWISKNNVFQYLGIHYVDLIRYITNSKPKKVIAIGQKNYLKGKNINTPDSIQTIIEWQNSQGISFTQTLLLNWIDPKNTTAMSDQNFKLVGTNGRIESDQKNRGVRIVEEGSYIEDINPDFCRVYGTTPGKVRWEGYGIESVKTFLKDIILIKKNKSLLKSLDEVRPTFKEALYSTAVLEAANYSLLNNSVWKKIKI